MATAQDHATQAPDINHPTPATTAAAQVVANAPYTAQAIATTGGGER